MNDSGKSEKMRLGLRVIVILAVLTAIEFAIAIYMNAGANLLLVLIALVKPWLIVDYFMHFTHAFRSSQGEE